MSDKKPTKTIVLNNEYLEDLFDAMKEAEDMLKVKFCLTSGKHQRYALKWQSETKELTAEDDNIPALSGFIYGYINGRMA